MNKDEAMQVFDGLMLGGGELLFNENSEIYFHIVYSDYPEHPIPFDTRVASLHHAVEAFRALGIEVEEGYPRVEPGVGKTLSGKPVRGCILKSKPYFFHDRMYSAG